MSDGHGPPVLSNGRTTHNGSTHDGPLHHDPLHHDPLHHDPLHRDPPHRGTSTPDLVVPARGAEPSSHTALRTGLVAFRRRWAAVLTIALLVALVAGLVGALVPARYTASSSVVVGTTGGTPDVSTARAGVLSLAGTTTYRADTAARSGLGLTAAQVADRLSVEPGDDGVLTVAGSGPTAADAGRLAVAATDALVAATGNSVRAGNDAATAPLREQMATVEQQLDSLSAGVGTRLAQQQRYDALAAEVARVGSAPSTFLVTGPVPAAEPTRSSPLRDAALAFLATVVVLAVATPLVRAWRGRLSEAVPAVQLRRSLGVPVVELDPAVGSPALRLGEVYRDVLRAHPTVTAVQLTRPAACDLGAELVHTADLLGDRRTHQDLTPGSTATPPGTGPSVVRSLRAPDIDRETARALRGAGPTVLVVDTATARIGAVGRSRDLLHAVGADVVAAVVWRGRVPRDPSRHWSPPEPGEDADLRPGV